MKVNLSKALTVDGKELFAGEQFVDDAVGEKLRGQDGVTFPDEGNGATEGVPAFDFAGNMTGSKAKKAKAALLHHMGVSPTGAKTSPTSADKPRQPAKEGS